MCMVSRYRHVVPNSQPIWHDGVIGLPKMLPVRVILRATLPRREPPSANRRGPPAIAKSPAVSPRALRGP